MNRKEIDAALGTAIDAAQAAGRLMRTHWHRPKKINHSIQHDIKLELDVRCQQTIERILRGNMHGVPILGEEGIVGDPDESMRWVVDPIDGTVNYAHGIPHACVCIALQQRTVGVSLSRRERAGVRGSVQADFDGFNTTIGVVFDPFANELWTAVRGARAKLNGKVINVSTRSKLNESIISLGFAKNRSTLQKMLPTFDCLVHRVRKIRIMGAAGLAMVYVACGRFDAYLEYGLRLWDIAAGGLIIECAGGDFWSRDVPGQFTYEIAASNRVLRKALLRLR